ncbi:MAG: histidine--tRNA ligase [Candidatus Taylorbacteria bacterium RIFCSPHIGHO2_02_FULL_46_13]|uniref:Histidine--tRNA ligase n=1 Tax=Candidatus Taylorbacteria bacterium RIFCSPHIGHO2_02_FULL_46_13 TaxID=1802312 RepID=A0A1G2MSR7_9BACT|nr:MAG: histidine--tRNA ligase [Candidatus Taylorbacteria bacterium RIFCSPHIGHO2_02_FULL_46_13]
MSDKKNIPSTESYKGVRDFYPKDMFVQNYIFSVMRTVAERYGYVEYGASILEPAELYRSKTSEEIVSEQTYTFTDRGEREVTLRPEMTPTLARMIAAKRRELAFPLRWYSIPNVFRYERPQRGRLREHWQLNADIFGVASIESEVEIISLAYHVMKKFGAKDEDFEIRINSRKLAQAYLEEKLFDRAHYPTAARLVDRKEKMTPKEFEEEWQKISSHSFDMNIAPNELVNDVIKGLATRDIKNVTFYPTLMRGFDYYIDVVFEVFDTNPKNNRSLFGGGRYDNLLEIFGEDSIPAVGFGMGDVTIRDFLETRGLLPEYRPSTDVYLIPISASDLPAAQKIAYTLRTSGINVAVDLTDKKVGDKIKLADKQSIHFALFVGEAEVKNEAYKLKNLRTQEEKTLPVEEVVRFVKGL